MAELEVSRLVRAPVGLVVHVCVAVFMCYYTGLFVTGKYAQNEEIIDKTQSPLSGFNNI